MIKTYNITEFAKIMNVSVKTLRRLDRSGLLVANRVLNNQYQYTDEHIQLFENAHQQYLYNRKNERQLYPDDLTGLRFGRLIVIKRDDDKITSKGKRCPQWLCKCNCGNMSIAMDNSLRAGYKKSCGCLKYGDSETQHMRAEYNNLTEDEAIKSLFVSQDKSVCSRIKAKPTGKLQDLTGQHFGLWTVIERGATRYYKNGGQAVCWVCKCECGAVKIVPGRDLKSGASQSCGCLSSTSWLEFYTKQYLIEHNYTFESQKSYSDLRGICGSLLYYDFVVLRDSKPLCVIECQGEQHYRPIKKFGGSKKLFRQIRNDEIKKHYAVNVLCTSFCEILYDNMTKNDVYNELDKIFSSLL